MIEQQSACNKKPSRSQACTRVALIFIPERINVWLRFGHPVSDRIVDRVRRVQEFAPRALFCRVRWEANRYGTVLWQLVVLQANAGGDPIEHVTGVLPGATILLEAAGSPQVQRALQVIDSIEALSLDPATVSPAYWRTVHQRLSARAVIPPYTRERHAAQQFRRSL